MLAVLITPPGRGALAVIHVAGEGARSLVGKLFAGRIGPHPRPGMFVVGGQPLDEVMARTVPGFTGEETVELTCHGGPAGVERILEELGKVGVRRVPEEELLERGVETGALDRIRAEAWGLLPGALTELAARVLQDQAEGALTRAVEAMSRQDIPEILRTAPLGRALAAPRRIVLAGRPNAGKSTLFNALVEADRVVVSDVPGTTRDPVREQVAIEQIPFELVDTAGVESPRDTLERLSIERTRESVRVADVVVFLFDAEAGVDSEERRLLEEVSDRPVVPVLNKVDAGGHRPDVKAMPISARSGEGIDELRKGILSALNLSPEVAEGAAVVFTERQERLLGEAASGAPLDEIRDQLLRGPA